MAEIHPTAVVAPDAQIADDVTVGPYSVIGPDVTIGPGCTLASHVVIEGRTTVGRNNRFFSHALVGGEPQDVKYRGQPTELYIGDGNTIRENVTIHTGTENGGGRTEIGDQNLIMAGAHIAHDCVIESRCIISNNVLLAGHILIEQCAVIGGASAVTQYVTIGQYAYIGGLSGVVHDCPPFLVCDGHPAVVRSVNLIGLRRHSFDEQAMGQLKQAYRRLFRREGHTVAEGIEHFLADDSCDPNVTELCRFIQRMSQSNNGRYAELYRRDDKRRTRPL